MRKTLLVSLIMVTVLLSMPTTIYAGQYPSCDVVDSDFNNDGRVGFEDFVDFVDAYGSQKGDNNYERQFDIDFDGDIDFEDFVLFSDLYGAELDNIRSKVKTGEHIILRWPDGWKCFLLGVNPNAVHLFTGNQNTEGWISVIHHSFEHNYVCGDFATDVMTAAYKGLGYGYLVYGVSHLHGYNMFWKGGDWHNLHNWGISDSSCDGIMFPDAAKAKSIWRTRYIYFPAEGMGDRWSGYCLIVDWDNARVDYGWGDGIVQFGIEEPIPDEFYSTKVKAP